MSVKTQKKIIEKTIIAAMAITFLISPCASLLAEDYPSYIGPGSREYSDGIIKYGTGVVSFIQKNLVVETLINKLNQLSEVADNAYQITEKSSEGILGKEFERKDNSDKLKIEIAQNGKEREKVASAKIDDGFTYIPYSDGKTVYFKDGLPIRIEGERDADEYGNVRIRNSNITYDESTRMPNRIETTLKDHLGNIFKIAKYNIKFSSDSVWYGGGTAAANKNETEYYLQEIDPAGNTRLTHFSNASYSGKTLQAFNQTIEDSIYGKAESRRFNIKGDSYDEEGIGTDGLAYTLHRENIITNGKNQEISYHEEKITTALDGGKIKATTDVKNTYLNVPHIFGPDVEELDPDRLLESIVTTTVENPDGSRRTETNTITNKYEGLKLIGASGTSNFNGQEAKWWEYTDGTGHLLSRNDKDGTITYSYVDPATKQTVVVPQGEVTAALKDGSKYSGSATMQYETPYGKPMAKQTDSLTSYYSPSGADLLRKENSTTKYANGLINNLPRLLNTNELINTALYPQVDPLGLPQMGIKNIATTYIYEANGNLSDAIGKGSGSGYELTDNIGWMHYTGDIDIDYEVILGEVKQKEYRENKDYEPDNN